MQSDYIAKHEKRFWAKVDKSGGDDACWNWIASITDGYGQMRWKDKKEKAHRIAWEIAHGSWPGALCVCHSCDNPSCVNPKHLFLGTRKDNADDRDRKGRNINHVGEKHGVHKLTESQVREMRSRYAIGDVTQTQLAKDYGVSQGHVHYIVRNKWWRHLLDQTPVPTT